MVKVLRQDYFCMAVRGVYISDDLIRWPRRYAALLPSLELAVYAARVGC